MATRSDNRQVRSGANPFPDPATTHAAILLAAVMLPYAVPWVAEWPQRILAPVIVYGLIVVCVPSLRNSMPWLRAGRMDRFTLGAAGIIGAGAWAFLTVWYSLTHPDLSHFGKYVPVLPLAQLVLFGAVFSLLNALVEEIVWRGVIQEALLTKYGPIHAIWIQGVIFGLAHIQGIPNGAAGLAMASLFGVSLGWLRWKSEGLGACLLAHIAADATIFALTLSARG